MLRFKLVTVRDVEIDSKEETCSPCAFLHFNINRPAPFPRPGNAWCGLFGADLQWPETVGEIVRLPRCRSLDGTTDGAEVKL